MQASDRRRLGKSGVEVPVIGFGGRAAGQPVPAVLRRAGPRHGPRRLRCRHAAVRHRPALWPRPVASTGSARRCAGSTATATCCRPRSAACSARATRKTVDGKLFKQVLPFEGVYDYSYDAVMRSVDDSLQRLGMHRIDVLLIHDVDVWTHGSEAARLRAVQGGHGRRLPCAWSSCASEGVVRAIGAGINEIQACEDFARAGDFDCFLLAGRYTLLEQAALDTLLPYCAQQRHLAADRRPLQYRHPRHRRRRGAYYNYAPAPAEILDRVRRIEAVCARHGVRLASAAAAVPARPSRTSRR